MMGVTQGFATFYGGTSLLIMVAVVLDTLQQIETQLLMRQYDGLMSTGRIQGRQSTAAPGLPEEYIKLIIQNIFCKNPDLFCQGFLNL